jgi:hypothetical protein
MNKDQELILEIMSQINHPEEYYKNALESNGIDLREINHHQISIYKAAMKRIEAEAMILVAKDDSFSVDFSSDIDFFLSNTKCN